VIDILDLDVKVRIIHLSKILFSEHPTCEMWDLWVWLESGHQDRSVLLSGEALQTALRWTENKILNAEELEFLKTSQKADRAVEEDLKQTKNWEEQAWICNGIPKNRKHDSDEPNSHEPYKNYGVACVVCGLAKTAVVRQSKLDRSSIALGKYKSNLRYRRPLWSYSLFQLPMLGFIVYLTGTLVVFLLPLDFADKTKWIVFCLGGAWITLMWGMILPLDRWLLRGFMKLSWSLSGKLALGNAFFWTMATPAIAIRLLFSV